VKFLFRVLALSASMICTTASAQGVDNYSGVPITSLLTVAFSNSSSDLRLTTEEAAQLQDAPNAALVTVRGRTSTNQPSAKDEALALARAISARNYLIKRGVSPLKISLNYASAMDFIADNSTPEGKLENQRVEIEMIYVLPAAALQPSSNH